MGKTAAAWHMAVFLCKKAVCFAMTINKIITFAPKDSK